MRNKFNARFKESNTVIIPDWYDDITAEGTITAVAYTGDRFTVKLTNGEDTGTEYVFDGNEIREKVTEPTTSKIHNWRDDPATGKQLEYLTSLGVEFYPGDNLTKGRASDLIDAAKRDELGSSGAWYTDGSN